MKKIILVLPLLLNACTYQVTSSIDIKKAEAFCNTRMGVHQIDVYFGGRERVECENGEELYLEDVKLTGSK